MKAEDEAAFREVFAGRARSLRRTAFLLCGDWHAAEDGADRVREALRLPDAGT